MKDRSRLISITTTCAMLVVMACVGLYYMQYDYNAVSYIKAFGYFVIAVSSVFALIFLKKEAGRRELVLGSLAFSAIMFVSAVFAIIPKTGNYSTLVSYFAMAFFAPVALCYIAKLATGKDIFDKASVCAIIFAISVIPVVLFAIIPASWTQIVLFVAFAIWALVLIAGVVFSVINIIKKKETFINWTYLFFTLPYTVTYVENIFNLRKYLKTCAGIAMMALAFLVIALVNKSEEKR